MANVTDYRLALINGLNDPVIRDFDLWAPQEGPQSLAFESEADELFFGGAAGGGKTDLIIGLALLRHRETIIYRREYTQFRSFIRRTNEVLAPIGVQFKQNWQRWDLPNRRIIELGSVPQEKDLQKHRGRPHDLIAFDEGTEFPEFYYRFLLAWNRSTDPTQRCRIILASNPPQNTDGEWVIRYWAPWIDPQYPNPASPGEIRWFITVDNKTHEVENNTPVVIKGKEYIPRSRTFIPSRVTDNKYLAGTAYESVLQNLSETERETLYEGRFFLSDNWDAFQVIPKRFVIAAQERWEPPNTSVPPDAIGIDPARGGDDETAIAFLYGNTFVLKSYPGKRTPDGSAVAALVLKELRNIPLDNVPIGVDVIGAGTSVVDILRSNHIGKVVDIHAGSKSRARSRELRARFANLRAQYHFRFRESLMEEPLAIPKGVEIQADLCAPRYGIQVRGIMVEEKDEIRKRIHRSPDKGEAILLCWHAARNATVLSTMVPEEW